jgi:hypothetical protein
MSEAVKKCLSTGNMESLYEYIKNSSIPWTAEVLAKLKSYAKDLLKIYRPLIVRLRRAMVANWDEKYRY